MKGKGLVAALVGVVAGLSGGVAIGTPVQWAGNGHWYEAVAASGGRITWEDAQKDAVARGGYLASITSAAENAFVYSLIDDSAYWHASTAGTGVGPWIGGVQAAGSTEPDGGWGWVSGEPFAYNNWLSNQPTNTGGNEDHIQFVGTGSTRSAYWNDLPNVPPNDWYVKGYVVESVPEPAALGLMMVGGVVGMSRRRRR